VAIAKTDHSSISKPARQSKAIHRNSQKPKKEHFLIVFKSYTQ
jgi:hypothetical protein